jgi:hypothetical protein
MKTVRSSIEEYLMRKIIRWIALMAVASLLFSKALVAAQDATPEATASGTIVCDSDLILSLYTAEHFFGFSQIVGMIPTPDPALIADVNTIDRGQYAPLFSTLTNSVPIVSMPQEEMQTISSMMQMDATAMQSQMASMMPAGAAPATATVLNAASIAGEDPTCTVLRAELNRFYTILNLQHMQNATANTGTTSTGASAATTTLTAPVSGIGGSNTTGSTISGNGGASSNGNTTGTGAQNTPPPGGGSPGG